MFIKYIIKLTSFIVLLSLITYTCYGNISNGEDITVEILLEKMKNAVDPFNKLISAKSKMTTGELYMPHHKIKADIITKFKAPNKFLVKAIINNITYSIQAYNGQYAWKSTQNSAPVNIHGRELDSFRLGVGLESIQRNWKDLFEKIEITDKNFQIDGYLCYQITCHPKRDFKMDSPYIFYVDKASFLLRRMDITVFSPVGNISETIIIDKYNVIEDIKIPVKTKTNIFGAEMLFTIKNIKFNININNSEFDFPENDIE